MVKQTINLLGEQLSQIASIVCDAIAMNEKRCGK